MHAVNPIMADNFSLLFHDGKLSFNLNHGSSLHDNDNNTNYSALDSLSEAFFRLQLYIEESWTRFVI